jgi:orotate phosphoribosyltransferase
MIQEALFSTGAIRVAEPDHPFWYTSGTIGPYYINTHFLYGGEPAASRLLERIEILAAEDRLTFASRLVDELMQQYAADRIYRQVIDAMARVAGAIDVDLISGGERRDFFFSLPVARLTGKPHLSIFKDGTCVWSGSHGEDARMIDPGTENERTGLRTLHIADIVTQAASFTRSWLPAVRGLGISMPAAMAVLDRKQDGRFRLNRESVELHVLAEVDDALFAAACEAGILTAGQLETVRSFNQDPFRFMKDFFESHPDFIQNQLDAGGKSRERALLCIQNGYAPPPETKES